jgi:hypothetical protein
MYIQFINQDAHNQPCVINSNFVVLKFIFKSPNFANDLHILNVNVTTGLEQECFTYTSFQFLWHYENRECSWTGFHDHSVISCWVPVQQEICNDCQSYSRQSVTESWSIHLLENQIPCSCSCWMGKWTVHKDIRQEVSSTSICFSLSTQPHITTHTQRQPI